MGRLIQIQWRFIENKPTMLLPKWTHTLCYTKHLKQISTQSTTFLAVFNRDSKIWKWTNVDKKWLLLKWLLRPIKNKLIIVQKIFGTQNKAHINSYILGLQKILYNINLCVLKAINDHKTILCLIIFATFGILYYFIWLGRSEIFFWQ